MAFDGFLKIDDLRGEALTKGYEEQIQVLAWKWDMDQTSTARFGSGRAAGRVNVHGLIITHYIDAAAPGLIEACCTGRHFREAILTLRKSGESPLEFFVLTLSDVFVASTSNEAVVSEVRAIQTVTLNFSMFELNYKPQHFQNGALNNTITASYNLANQD